MSENQKVTNEQIQSYLAMNLATLTLEEKYRFFQTMERPINFALNKVLQKFNRIPLEKEDFQSIAWFAFDEVLTKYKPTLTHKSFVTYVIDNVYWKAMDYACKFINNRHKVLNLSDPYFSWKEVPNVNWNVDADWTTPWYIEDYFTNNNHDQLAKAVFIDYLAEVPLIDIREKYQISRHKLKQTIQKTLVDISRSVI